MDELSRQFAEDNLNKSGKKGNSDFSDLGEVGSALGSVDDAEGCLVVLFLIFVTGGFFITYYLNKFFEKKLSEGFAMFLNYTTYTLQVILYGRLLVFISDLQGVDFSKVMFWLYVYIGVLVIIAIITGLIKYFRKPKTEIKEDSEK